MGHRDHGGLKYRVICLEPAEVMLRAAEKRVAAALQLRRMPGLAENVSYHCSTLEEADFIADASADAMIFFESFHHIIDEHKALEQAFRILRPHAPLCILGDSNWIPGLKEQEDFWIEEMERFGTLESPFTHQYLVELLGQHGFKRVTRNHSVNQLVAVEKAALPAEAFAGDLNAAYVNLILARRAAARNGAAAPHDIPAASLAAVQPEPPALSRLERLGKRLANRYPPLRPALHAIRRLLR